MPAFSHYPSLGIVSTVALVLWAGLLGILVARRTGIPAILFFLAFGVLLGPDFLGLVVPERFGDVGLRAIVSICVAIVVFEGAMKIDLRQMRRTPAAVVGLVTVAPLLTATGAACAAHWIGGLGWRTAAVFGAIVSVTGPTVINPILRRIRVGPRLRAILEAESVLVDAVGVLLTAAVFTFITAADQTLAGGGLRLVGHLAIGGGIGLAAAIASVAGLRRLRSMSGAAVHVWVLATALIAYSAAEVAAHEAGIAAVAVAGLVIGSREFPGARSARNFKESLTLLALVMVFLLLAAGQNVGSLTELGWGGLGTIVALMFLVRPISTFLATAPSALSWRERAFIAWMGPRGIVAASLASLMAVELKAWGMAGGEALGSLVFLTVLVTVVVQGGLAGQVARRLGVIPKPVVVVGGDETARWLARHLHRQGEAVILVDRDPTLLEDLEGEPFEVWVGDLAAPRDLARVLGSDPTCMVAATASDKANLLICQQVRAKDARIRLVARLADGRLSDAFRALDIEVLCEPEGAGLALAHKVTRSTVLELLSSPLQAEAVAEVRLAGTARPLSLAESGLPPNCLVVLVKRDGALLVPNGGTVLQPGELVTLVGKAADLAEARRRLEGEPAASLP
ncbi:MAG: cation:proton antiporter [Candidatus Sericytochromatia bacterium]|nr:cation:proton antiporter [Candidatus Tanganyikabacteria bacterium]